MNCPFHVCVAMRFEPNSGAQRIVRRKGASTHGESEELETLRKRLGIYRCAVAGCFQVHEPPEEEKKSAIRMCSKPRCNNACDAPSYRLIVHDYRCMECWRKAQAKNKHDREMRARKAGDIGP